MVTEPNTKTGFYYVEAAYIEYLKNAEINSRGFSCVPNVHYWNTDKFLFGAVLSINNIYYFAPISSYSKPQEDLILLRDKKNHHVLGSIRFNYMIPVPKECLIKLDIKKLPTVQSKAHTSKELAFCRRNRDKIYKTARRTYNQVLSGRYPELNKNSCDFQLLEQKCLEYTASLAQEPILPNQMPNIGSQGFGGLS